MAVPSAKPVQRRGRRSRRSRPRPARRHRAAAPGRAARAAASASTGGALAGAGAVALIAFVVYVLTVAAHRAHGGQRRADRRRLHGRHRPSAGLPALHDARLRRRATSRALSPATWMNLFSGLPRRAHGRDRVPDRPPARSARPGSPRSAGACRTSRPRAGALLLAFSTDFWAYSVVAEVFALNNLLAALLLLLALEWARRPQRRSAALGVHVRVRAGALQPADDHLLRPGVRLLAGWGWTALARPNRSLWQPRPLWILGGAWIAALVLLLVGLKVGSTGVTVAGLVVLGLLVVVSLALVLPWRDVAATVGAFVSARAAALPADRRLAEPGRELGRPGQLGTLPRRSYCARTTAPARSSSGGKPRLALAQHGADLQQPHHRLRVRGAACSRSSGSSGPGSGGALEGIALFTAFLVAGPIFQLYTNTAYPDDLTKGIIARFYILPSIPVAIVAGLGAWWVLEQAASVALRAARGRGRQSRRGRAPRRPDCRRGRPTTPPATSRATRSPRTTRTTCSARCRRTRSS